MDHHHQYPHWTTHLSTCNLRSLEDGLLQEKIQGLFKGGHDGLTQQAASSSLTDCFQSQQVAQRTGRGLETYRPIDSLVLRLSGKDRYQSLFLIKAQVK